MIRINLSESRVARSLTEQLGGSNMKIKLFVTTALAATAAATPLLASAPIVPGPLAGAALGPIGLAAAAAGYVGYRVWKSRQG